ncbi:hypothetical protein V8E36_001842 [Tilletia maclaganii]
MGFMYNALRGFIHIARLGFIYIARMGHIYHAFYLRLNSCSYHRGPPLPAPRRPRYLSRLRPLRSPPSASPGLVLPELLRPTLLAPLRPVASPCRPPSLCASPPPSLFLPTPSPRPTPFPLLMQQMHLTLVAALRAPRSAPISRLPPICGGPTTANPHLRDLVVPRPGRHFPFLPLYGICSARQPPSLCSAISHGFCLSPRIGLAG